MVEVVALTLLLATAGSDSGQAASLAKAKAVYDRFAKLDNARDVAALDLVADDAVIRIRSENADGQMREIQPPCSEWKTMLRQVLQMGGPGPSPDQHSYTECRSELVQKGARITCVVSSRQESGPSSLSLLMRPGSDGKWLIREYVIEQHYGKH